MAIAGHKLQLPIRNYPVQENGNGTKDLMKTGNLCGLPSHKYQKAAQNSRKCGYQMQVHKGRTSVYSNVQLSRTL